MIRPVIITTEDPARYRTSRYLALESYLKASDLDRLGVELLRPSYPFGHPLILSGGWSIDHIQCNLYMGNVQNYTLIRERSPHRALFGLAVAALLSQPTDHLLLVPDRCPITLDNNLCNLIKLAAASLTAGQTVLFATTNSSLSMPTSKIQNFYFDDIVHLTDGFSQNIPGAMVGVQPTGLTLLRTSSLLQALIDLNPTLLIAAELAIADRDNDYGVIPIDSLAHLHIPKQQLFDFLLSSSNRIIIGLL